MTNIKRTIMLFLATAAFGVTFGGGCSLLPFGQKALEVM